MMIKFCILLIYLLAANLVLCQNGFLNIDCGNTKNYTDPSTNLVYIPDDQYIDTGTNFNINDSYKSKIRYQTDSNLRSFPNGVRNCYTLKPVLQNNLYLIRTTFFYGNYDGLDSVQYNKPISFDLHIGANYWRTVNINKASDTVQQEATTIALADFLSVCLVNKGQGTPFINSLEMRPVKKSLYPYMDYSSQFIDLILRLDCGGSKFTRYPDDIYDRIWKPYMGVNTRNISTSLIVDNNNDFKPPIDVLQTAILSSNSNKTNLFIYWTKYSGIPPFVVNYHFAEIQVLPSRGMSEFNIYFNGMIWIPDVRPTYLKVDTIYTLKPLADPSPGSEEYNFSFVATSNSTARPLINAIEIFSLLNATYAMTDLADVDAILAIKSEYKVNKGWSGDPCAPVTYTWDGIGCNFTGDSTKIISLNLSSSGLTGPLSGSFSKLQNLKTLDLSNNKLNGTIPDFLSKMTSLQVLNLSCNSFNSSVPAPLQQKSSAGQITLKNDNKCNRMISDANPKKMPIAVIVSVIIVAVVVLLFVFFGVRYKRRLRITDHIPIPENEIVRLKTKKYTKRDLEKITNNFARKIGRGGFGGVFFGTLTNGTSVAVKRLSETSTQGLRQFLTEAESLAMLHHRNMLSLLGYCEDRSCLALVYEYMSQGSLEDHLKGRQDFERTLGWRERLHVVTEAAQGLDYLHRGGEVPIVHRDVKSSNILLGSNLEAKVSDLGLAKTFRSSTQKETNTTAIYGTLGYIDPEYFNNGMLSEKSDVYSFGVVILEIITGLSPIIKDPAGDINLVHYINDKIKHHEDITSLVDKRFQGNFDINYVWKVMELALSCTQEKSPPRPTMADVLAQLLISLELENLQEGSCDSDYST